MRKILLAILLAATALSIGAKKRTDNDRRIIFIMIDGLRWQELYTGADAELAANTDFTRNKNSVKAFLGIADTAERRAALMPFTWSYIRRHGLMIGNRTKGSLMQVANRYAISYPGYSETLTGHPDDERIQGNGAGDNPNINILEVANASPRYRGSVRVFARWGTQRQIVGQHRNHLPVIAGRDMYGNSPHPSEKELLLDEMKRKLFDFQGNAQLDLWAYHYAAEQMRTLHPKFVFLQLGDTDLHGHNGRYDYYLSAVHNIDDYLRLLWEQVQADPFYRDKTTLLITCDHGRGLGPEWCDHGPSIQHANETWLMALGKDIPALGEMTDNGPFYNKQVAATLAALLGIDYAPQGWEIGQKLFFAE